MRALTRSMAPLLVVAAIVAGCGSDVPSKDQFIADAKKAAGKEFDSSLKAAGITGDSATQLFNSFYGCVYEKIKDNEDLLSGIADAKGQDSSELQKALESKAKSCVDTFTTELTKQASSGLGDGSGTTDTTTSAPS